ncbi:MAG: hypothetical protein ACM3S1_02270 [Hyphomicrobiales bacterium]
MREATYRAAEILAWTTAAWCAVECVLRIALGETDGLAASGVLVLAGVGVGLFGGAARRFRGPSAPR